MKLYVHRFGLTEANPDSLLQVWERKHGATKEKLVRELQEKRRTVQKGKHWMVQCKIRSSLAVRI